MTVRELINELESLSTAGYGEARVEVRNVAGDSEDVEVVKPRDGVIYIES